MVSEGDGPYGYSLTRRSLDPISAVWLRRRRVSICSRVGGDRPAWRRPAHRCDHPGNRWSDARDRRRLVVAADGRDSGMARLARVPARIRPNSRFYWAYWSGLEPGVTRSRAWILEPDVAYTFPMEDGLAVVMVGPHHDRAGSSAPIVRAPT